MKYPRKEIENEVRNGVFNEVHYEVVDKVHHEVWNEVANKVSNEVFNEVGRSVMLQVIDQIQNVIDMLKNDPSSRRIIVSGWNVGEIYDLIHDHHHAPPPFFGHLVRSENDNK